MGKTECNRKEPEQTEKEKTGRNITCAGCGKGCSGQSGCPAGGISRRKEVQGCGRECPLRTALVSAGPSICPGERQEWDYEDTVLVFSSDMLEKDD